MANLTCDFLHNVTKTPAYNLGRPCTGYDLLCEPAVHIVENCSMLKCYHCKWVSRLSENLAREAYTTGGQHITSFSFRFAHERRCKWQGSGYDMSKFGFLLVTLQHPPDISTKEALSFLRNSWSAALSLCMVQLGVVTIGHTHSQTVCRRPGPQERSL